MITKRSVVDQIEITSSGVIQIRFKKQLVDGGNELSYEYHRTSLAPGVLLANQMKVVNAHLGTMGWPAVGAAEIARIRAIADVVRANGW